MPSPRKRAKPSPQKLARVPLRESTLNADAHDAGRADDDAPTPAGPSDPSRTAARLAAAATAAPRKAPGPGAPSRPRLGPAPPISVRSPPATPAQDEDRALHAPTLGTMSTTRTASPERRVAVRPPAWERPPSAARRASPPDPLARPVTRTSRPAGPRPAAGCAPDARPATALAAARATPERPGPPASSARYAMPVRAAPERLCAAQAAAAERLATPVPRVRAKITEGVARRARREEPVAGPSRVSHAAAPVARASPAPTPVRAPPGAAERVDVDAVVAELGEDSSFVLEGAEALPGSDSVQVHIRLRPPSCADEASAWVATPETSTVMLDPAIAAAKVQPHVGLPYQFDGLHTGSSNADVYAELARPLVQSVLRGYNAVVFAYGQTASGKTFTLSGAEDGGEPGIIPRAVSDVFHGICQSSCEREYLVRVSYLEIWNEIVRDLLDPSTQPQVRDDRRRGAHAVIVAPLQEEVVTSPSQAFALWARGEANRHVGTTDWNERSSRSHTCFKVTVESWERTPALDAGHVGRHYRISELSLIDLAGSERHTWGPSRRTEGANINKSLLSLGKVIYALSERSAAERSERARLPPVHVPFRDSKLTRILQNSLNGNARIAVVCTLNPSPAMVEESLGTLNFARRIKQVAVRAEPNEVDGDLSLLLDAPSTEAQALLARYRAEMGALRAQVAQLQQAPPPASTALPPASQASPASPPSLPSPATPVRPALAPTGACSTPTPASVEALQARLDELGALILRGGTEPPPAAPHPVSPAKQRGFAFDDPLPLVQEKLHAALSKIARLERKLAHRLSVPGYEGDAAKDARIDALLRRVQELETVCAAHTAAAPASLREEVQAEFSAELETCAQRIAERDAFLAEVTSECERLRRVNTHLVRLAHQDTEKMVASLSARPERPVMSLFAPHLRPTTVLGRAPGSMPTSPVRAWDRPLSIDGTESDTLSNSDLDEVLESRESL